jgi:hypothetical protein
MIGWWESLTLLQQVLATVGITGVVILLIQMVLMLLGAIGAFGGSASEPPDLEAAGDAGFEADAPALDFDAEPGDVGLDLDTDIDLDTVGDPAGMAASIADNPGSYVPAYGREPVMARMDGAAKGGRLRLFTLHGVVCFMAIFGWSGLAMLRAGAWAVLALPIAAVLGLLAMVLIAALMRAMLGLQQDGTWDIRYALGESGTVYLPIYPHRQRPGKVNLTLQGHFVELAAVTDADHKIPTGTPITVVGIEDDHTLLVLD